MKQSMPRTSKKVYRCPWFYRSPFLRFGRQIESITDLVSILEFMGERVYLQLAFPP